MSIPVPGRRGRMGTNTSSPTICTPRRQMTSPSCFVSARPNRPSRLRHQSSIRDDRIPIARVLSEIADHVVAAESSDLARPMVGAVAPVELENSVAAASRRERCDLFARHCYPRASIASTSALCSSSSTGQGGREDRPSSQTSASRVRLLQTDLER